MSRTGRSLFTGFFWAVPGYLAGAFGGGWLVSLLSTNTHDRSVEAAMTGAFVLGPLGAVAAFIAGVLRRREPPPPTKGEAR